MYSAELERGDERSATALALSKTICFDAEGNDSMSFMDAYRLSDALAVKLMAEVTAVNGGVR